MSVSLAFKAFFAALFNRESAEKIRLALADAATPAQPPAAIEAGPSGSPKAIAAGRSDALTLLATLQREARLLDLVHESLDSYQDAQIGAAAREVLRDSRKSLERMFGIQPLSKQEEGMQQVIEPPLSPHKIRLIGKSEGSSGVVVHRGWQATQCEIPKWNGRSDEAWMLAPVELEVS